MGSGLVDHGRHVVVCREDTSARRGRCLRREPCSVLRHLAETRSKEDPLGSLARTVLTGEASLRTAAGNPWHGQGLGIAMQNAIDEQNHIEGPIADVAQHVGYSGSKLDWGYAPTYLPPKP